MTDPTLKFNARSDRRGSVATQPRTELQVPFSPEAERSVLGSILLNPELAADIIAFNLQPEDFYLAAHRNIYRRILDIALTSRPIDLVSVAEELQNHQELDVIGGYAYLSDLVCLSVPERKHVLYHSAIVVTKARLRRIQIIGARAQSAAGAPGADPKRLGREMIVEIDSILMEGKK
jgi:replicative DNA helicase